MTKKRIWVYPLQEIKKLIREDKIFVPPSRKVMESTNNMCLTLYEAHLEILELEIKDYWHSVTDFYNNQVWQDVYKKKIKGVNVYIKFKIFNNEFQLLSFKPDESK